MSNMGHALPVFVLSMQKLNLPIHRPTHRLRTPNEGKNQSYLKNWAGVADKICCRHT